MGSPVGEYFMVTSHSRSSAAEATVPGGVCTFASVMPLMSLGVVAWRTRYHASSFREPRLRAAALRASMSADSVGARAARSASTVKSPSPTGEVNQPRQKTPPAPYERTQDVD